MGRAMCVFSRLFLWGAVSPHRDESLITQIIQHVRAAAQLHQPILFAVDGLHAYVTAILNVFRDPVHTGQRGRPWLVVWADLHIVQVVKHRVGQRLDSIERRVAHGCQHTAEAIMQATQTELGVINTAYIERLNATFGTWMPTLFRRTRAPARKCHISKRRCFGRVVCAIFVAFIEHWQPHLRRLLTWLTMCGPWTSSYASDQGACGSTLFWSPIAYHEVYFSMQRGLDMDHLPQRIQRGFRNHLGQRRVRVDGVRDFQGRQFC